MFKNIKSLIKILLFAVLTVVIGMIFLKVQYEKVLTTPNSESTEKITLTIDEGETVDTIITKLVEVGILKENWKTFFKWYLKTNNLYSKIQAGEYQLPLNLNIRELADTIQHATNPDIWITVPEGMRKDQIAKLLSDEFSKYQETNFSQEEFLTLTNDLEFISSFNLPEEVKDLEGYIFPDKYAFPKDSNTQTALSLMVNNFVKKVGVQDSYEDIIIASMVEREGYNDQDRPMIADVIQRRYAEGWLLQIDATLLYPKKDWTSTITKEDKASDSPYNTYKKLGLPPTPICNPGLESINAVREPEANSYYYYIHDENGNVYFAKTLAEHNANVQKYLR